MMGSLIYRGVFLTLLVFGFVGLLVCGTSHATNEGGYWGPETVNEDVWQLAADEKGVWETLEEGGEVTEICGQSMNIFFAPFYTPWHDGPTPEWGAKLSLTFLFE